MDKVFDNWNRLGERVMATPIKEGGPLPQGVGDAPKEPLHPGFYTGDDAVEWAKNKAALLRHINYQLRQQRNSSVEPLITANEREATMIEKLLTR